MNKTSKIAFLTLALIASAGASATNYGVGAQVTGNAQSIVSGSTSSYSVANGVNQNAAHGSFAASTNSAGADGSGAYIGNKYVGAGVATTTAQTNGATLTGAGGYGDGGSSAYASQYGEANSKATLVPDTFKTIKVDGQKVQVIDQPGTWASSGATVGTESAATNIGSGAAISGSKANATNTSVVTAGHLFNKTTATGVTVGTDKTSTFGYKVGGNETVYAGGTLQINKGTTAKPDLVNGVGSIQNGSFSGNVKVTNGKF